MNQHKMTMSEFAPGQRVIWRHELRGGYGYIERIPGEVVRVTAKRVIIRVGRHLNPYAIELVERSVRPEHLLPAS